jgi:hypothetical protein
MRVFVVLPVQVSTPSAVTALASPERDALAQLVQECCPDESSSSKAAVTGSKQQRADATVSQSSGWCSSVGRAAAQVDGHQHRWYADICHVAPNVCGSDGRLRRMALPPYSLSCRSFPKVQ